MFDYFVKFVLKGLSVTSLSHTSEEDKYLLEYDRKQESLKFHFFCMFSDYVMFLFLCVHRFISLFLIALRTRFHHRFLVLLFYLRFDQIGIKLQQPFRNQRYKLTRYTECHHYVQHFWSYQSTKSVSQFYEILIFRQDIWVNNHYVPEINLIS